MNPWAKIRQWSRLFSEYAVAQGTIQLLGLLAGLWLVNFLPVREYALYTFGLSIFTFLALFSDLGASSALLYFRRETRIAQVAFAPYVRAALRFRRALLTLGACGGLAFMAVIGRDRGFGAAEIAATGAALVAAVWIQVSVSLSLIQLRLEGLYRESYLAELCGNAARLAAVAAMWLATMPIAWLAMLTGAIGPLVTKLVAGTNIPWLEEEPLQEGTRGKHDPMKGIVRYVLPMSLSAAYFSIQAPLTVWLSAYFAGTESVAEVGALGRLGMIFGLLSGFVGTVFIPRMSVVTDDLHYSRRYLQFWAALLAFGAAVIILSYAFPEWLLFLLGDAYRSLASGVFIVAISSVLSAWGGYAVGINSARGWVRHQPVVLVMFVGIQITLIVVLNLSTTMGVLYYGLWSNFAGLVLQVAINVIGFHRPDWVATRK